MPPKGTTKKTTTGGSSNSKGSPPPQGEEKKSQTKRGEGGMTAEQEAEVVAKFTEEFNRLQAAAAGDGGSGGAAFSLEDLDKIRQRFQQSVNSWQERREDDDEDAEYYDVTTSAKTTGTGTAPATAGGGGAAVAVAGAAGAVGAGGGIHGYAVPADVAANWKAPKCVCKSDTKARPGYSDMDASEYLDRDDVLMEKCKILKKMLEASSATVAYTGAGISTPAGIGDYASKGSGSVVKKEGSSNRLNLQPTKTHRVMAAMEKKGFLHEWVNQNHDGLAQKAGYPFAKLNEIHGGWFDKKNPVVLMDGHLRKDLWKRLEDWAAASECVLAMGTSLCGMGADLVCHKSHQLHTQQGIGQGMVIINLQHTPLDDKAALRIYARTDDVFACLQKLWKLKLDTEVYSAYPPTVRGAQKSTPPPAHYLSGSGAKKA